MSLVATRERIEAQQRRVESLPPGSDEHRIAANVLLLLQDSLHVLTEADDMIRAARAATRGRRPKPEPRPPRKTDGASDDARG